MDSCAFCFHMLLLTIDREKGDSAQNRYPWQVKGTGWPRWAPVPGSVGACIPEKGHRPWQEVRRSAVIGAGMGGDSWQEQKGAKQIPTSETGQAGKGPSLERSQRTACESQMLKACGH